MPNRIHLRRAKGWRKPENAPGEPCHADDEMCALFEVRTCAFCQKDDSRFLFNHPPGDTRNFYAVDTVDDVARKES